MFTTQLGKIIIVSVLGIAFLSGTVFYKIRNNKQHAVIKNEAEHTVIPKQNGSTMPDEFFKTIPEEIKPVPINAIDEYPVTEEQLIQARPIPTPRNEINEEELLIKDLDAKRINAGKVFIVDHDDSDGKDIIKIIPASSDKDFSSNDQPATEPTYPVNLERVVLSSRFINAELYTEINSELASEKVIARIENNIIGAHGRKILIPMGSEAIGRYKTLKKQGDTRIQIDFYRIITPDGIDIDLVSEVADSSGVAGITGEVDTRWKEKYGTALLVSTINAAGHLTLPLKNDKEIAVANAFANPLSQVTAKSLEQGLDLEPRVKIAKGTRITISPRVDIWFKKPRNGRAEAVSLDKKLNNKM